MNKQTEVIGNYVFNTFKEIVGELRSEKVFSKPFEFVVSKTNECNYAIYIQGNKTAGDAYELTTWKTVPVVQCQLMHFSPIHPTMPGQEYLDLRVNYSGFWGSEYAQQKYIDNGFIKEQLTKAIKTAVNDFTIQETI